MAYYTLCFLGDLKEVRAGQFEVFITIAYLWTVVGWLRVKTSREFMLYRYGQKLHFVSLFLRFTLLLLKRQLLLLTCLWNVLPANKLKKHFSLTLFSLKSLK